MTAAAKVLAKVRRETAEDQLYWQLGVAKLPMPVREYSFAVGRKYRFDFAWITRLLAAEIEGGLWSKGAHARPRGILRDIEKYNLATELGWRVYRFSTDDVKSGHALAVMTRILKCASEAS